MSPSGDGAALRYPFATAPAPGALTQVAPGVRWLQMPLPFALNHINLWLLEDGAGWTVVDSGLDTPQTRELWTKIFETALGGKPVTRLIVTHFHPDHMGLAGWLTENLKVTMWCSEGEWLWARMLSLDTTAGFTTNALDFYRRTGLDGAMAAAVAGRGNSYRKRVSPVPYRYHRIADGESIAIGDHRWRVIIGRGHAPEHASLYCADLDLLIAGDQVLPRISPNISLWPQEPEGDPLALYLASLARMKQEVPASALVLPSHNRPFHGLDRRIGELTAHHEARLADIEATCAEPRSTAEIVPILFRRALDIYQMGFAIGESLAHIRYLLGQDRLTREERADGVYLYRRR